MSIMCINGNLRGGDKSLLSVNIVFCVCFVVEGDDIAEDVQKFGFPRKHRHKLCCLRQELIEAFTE